MADSNDIYLPPGWTEEMYENPMEHEAAWDALTDEQFQRLQARRAGHALASTAATTTTPSSLPAPCVEAIEEAGLTEWGFSIFRVNYDDDQAWATFLTKFEAMINTQLTPASGAGIDAVRDSMQMNFINDRVRLEGATAQDVRDHCRELADLPNSPDSLRFSAVLMVDAAAMESVIAFQPKEYPPETPSREKRRGAPWLWAVDLEYEAEQDGGGEGNADDEEYEGVLKVAVSSLVNEFFPIVATGRLALEELLPSDGDEGVWFSVIGF